MKRRIGRHSIPSMTRHLTISTVIGLEAKRSASHVQSEQNQPPSTAIQRATK